MKSLHRRLAGLLELPGSGRLRPMEGLRGIAVTLVFFVHFENLFGDWLAPHSTGLRVAEFLRDVGHVGVDLFFGLSGYLIYGAVISKERFSYGDFLRRRAVRIYPTFGLVLAVYVALALLAPGEGKLPPGRLEATLYILQNALLLPGMIRIPPLIGVAWSLSYEVFFYAVIPLLVTGLALRARPVRSRLWFFAGLGLAVLLINQLGFGHVQLVMFISGIFVFELLRGQAPEAQPSPRLAQASVTLAVVVLPVVYLIVSGPELFGLGYSTRTAHAVREVWLALALGVITLASLQAEGPLPRALVFTPLRWLGNMSYSYYLIHGLVLKALSVVAHRLLPGEHGLLHWAILPVAYAGTLVGSAILYGTVEKRISLVPPQPAPAPVARAGDARGFGLTPARAD